MTKTLRNIMAIGAFCCAITATAAQTTGIKVQDVNVDVNEKAQTVTVALDLDMKDFKVPGNGEVIYTPVIVSEDGTNRTGLPSFTVCGRSRYYLYMREGALDSCLAPIYRAGSRQELRIRETLPLQSWMLDNGTVEIHQSEANCCGTPTDMVGDSKWGNILVARMHAKQPNLTFDYIFSPPMEDQPVEKSYEGRAFVTFVVNKTDLNPSYMNNPAELRKILNTIDIVRSDPDAVITEIHIKGYASPEGAYSNNIRLAKGRTATLSSYVNSLYHFEPGIMTTSFEPEDWEGLRGYVKDSLQYNLTNRAGLLEIIDGPLDYDARDAALKKDFPRDYAIILKDIYPWLRHSDYTVKYQIKVYSDLENLNRLYKEDPTKLRPVDFYTIAGQYPVGSADYQSVMLTAASVYPNQPMINLNAANIYMQQGLLDEAGKCLAKAGDSPEAIYARGVLAAKEGKYQSALSYFLDAKANGLKNADTYINQIEEALNANPVELFLTPVAK